MIHFTPVYGSTFTLTATDESTNVDISTLAKDATHLLIQLTDNGYPVAVRLGPSPQTATVADMPIGEMESVLIRRDPDDDNIAAICVVESTDIIITAGFAY